MKGWRTIIVAAFPLIWAVLAAVGVDVPLEQQGEIVAGVTAILMIVMRTQTDSPVGKDY